MKRGLLFLNGTPPTESTLKSIDFSGKTVICADGAYNYLKNYAVPDLLLGDFDSVIGIPDGVAKKRFPVDKDYTDGHLAVVEAAALKVEFLEIYGAFGGRPDHEYANFALLAIADSLNIKAVLKGDYDVYFVKGEFGVSVQKNVTVSIVPYSDTAHILSTKGLKFRADGLTMNKLHLIGVSNTAIDDKIQVCVDSGSVLVFVQRSCL